jgi:hypothetical protein
MIMRTNLFVVAMAFVVMALAAACHSDPSARPEAHLRSDGDIIFRLHLGGFHTAEPNQ